MMKSPTAVFLITALLTGCASPAYYGQAISGHLSIMHDRQDIQTIIQDGEVDPALRAELEQALAIREFASDQLGLPRNGSYRQYVHTGREAVTWNVIAAPEFSLEPKRWCFLVAGCVPYRGYFDKKNADKFARSMQERSLEVFVSPAIAYSTLGWFDDPLLDTMLRYSDAQLAGFIFHELAHQQLYVKNDSAFNESYATFIEDVGVEAWLLATRRDEALSRWQAQSVASASFDSLLRHTRQLLMEEFSSGHDQDEMRENKRSIYAEMKVQYARLVTDEWNGKDYFESWFMREINNARMVLINSYQGGLCAFKTLYEQAGRDIVKFQQMAAEKASLNTEQRMTWLSQPCDKNQAGQ